MISVSAVMPTRGRREYAKTALECFLSQTWPEKELVILDDADDRSFETPPVGDNINYILADRRRIIPEKRDIVCEAARGEYIVHFDSDDWSHPDRIAHQVEFTEHERKAVSGFRMMYFWDDVDKQTWLYRGMRNYVLGTSLMFKRSWWMNNRWDRRFRIGSDNVFITKAANKKQLAQSELIHLMVARRHSGSTNTRKYGVNFKKAEREMLPAGFLNEIGIPQTPVSISATY